MTKKHYTAIAEIVGHISDACECDRITEEFCRILKADNPRFDPRLFCDAVLNSRLCKPFQKPTACSS